MITEKAGCFLIKKETKEIALIYRKKQNDYSFPKIMEYTTMTDILISKGACGER